MVLQLTHVQDPREHKLYVTVHTLYVVMYTTYYIQQI